MMSTKEICLRDERLGSAGGCCRCAYRKRLEGDFLCQRCREDRDIERARKRQDVIAVAAIDALAAQPDRVHNASNLDCGVSGRRVSAAVSPHVPR